MRIKQPFPINLFQRNKANTVCDKKIYVFLFNNANSVPKHTAVQYRYVRLHDKFRHYCDTQVATMDIYQRKRKSKYIKS